MTRLLTFHGSVAYQPAIDDWLASRPADLGAIAKTWFDRLRRSGPGVSELMHDGHPTVCIGEAALAYVGVFRSHVNVGFFRGAFLPDPHGLLEGTGKSMRHVKLRPGVHVDEKALQALVTAAHADLRSQLDSAGVA